jgi:hypothetical protein
MPSEATNNATTREWRELGFFLALFNGEVPISAAVSRNV